MCLYNSKNNLINFGIFVAYLVVGFEVHEVDYLVMSKCFVQTTICFQLCIGKLCCNHKTQEINM